jgi:NAD(P)H-dependent FMN reductase
MDIYSNVHDLLNRKAAFIPIPLLAAFPEGPQDFVVLRMKQQRKHVLALSGSVRKDSANEAILKAVGLLYPRLDIRLYDIGKLPYFNPGLVKEGSAIPAAVQDFHDRIGEADGVLICTPEYVFALPGALKNALEWTVSTTVFSYKPMAFIVASASGEKAFESLDLIMKTLLQEPVDANRKLLVRGGSGKISASGGFTDAGTLAQVRNLVDHFIREMDERGKDR